MQLRLYRKYPFPLGKLSVLQKLACPYRKYPFPKKVIFLSFKNYSAPIERILLPEVFCRYRNNPAPLQGSSPESRAQADFRLIFRFPRATRCSTHWTNSNQDILICAVQHLHKAWARIFKPFKKHMNRFPAQRIGTRTLFDVSARQATYTQDGGIDSLLSIPWNRFLGSLNVYKYGLCKHRYTFSVLHRLFCRTNVMCDLRCLYPNSSFLTWGYSRLWHGVVVPACQPMQPGGPVGQSYARTDYISPSQGIRIWLLVSTCVQVQSLPDGSNRIKLCKEKIMPHIVFLELGTLLMRKKLRQIISRQHS